MQTKLTLRLDDELVRFGKEFARKRGKSLSRIVADYLLLMERQDHEHRILAPKTRSLLGLLKGKDVDERDYRAYLEEKHQ